VRRCRKPVGGIGWWARSHRAVGRWHRLSGRASTGINAGKNRFPVADWKGKCTEVPVKTDGTAFAVDKVHGVGVLVRQGDHSQEGQQTGPPICGSLIEHVDCLCRPREPMKLVSMVSNAEDDVLQVVDAFRRAAASRTFCTAGISRPDRTAMMAMTNQQFDQRERVTASHGHVI